MIFYFLIWNKHWSLFSALHLPKIHKPFHLPPHKTKKKQVAETAWQSLFHPLTFYVNFELKLCWRQVPLSERAYPPSWHCTGNFFLESQCSSAVGHWLLGQDSCFNIIRTRQNVLCSVRAEEVCWCSRLTRFVPSVSAKWWHWCVLTSRGGGRERSDRCCISRWRRTVSARYPNLLSFPFAAEMLELSGYCH